MTKAIENTMFQIQKSAIINITICTSPKSSHFFFGMCVITEMIMMKHVNSYGSFTPSDSERRSDMNEKLKT